MTRMLAGPKAPEILGRIGFTDVSFDEVTHCPGRTRLLVVAQRS